MVRAMGANQITMADASSAERQSGYKVGGISPFATLRRMPVVMDTELLCYDRVAINAGQRGVMLVMAPGDIQQALGAAKASLTA